MMMHQLLFRVEYAENGFILSEAFQQEQWGNHRVATTFEQVGRMVSDSTRKYLTQRVLKTPGREEQHDHE